MGETPRAQAQRSAIGEVEPMQRIRREKYFSPCKLGETPNTQALRSVFGQVEPIQRCGISTPKAQKFCAQQGVVLSNASPAKLGVFESVSKNFLTRSNRLQATLAAGSSRCVRSLYVGWAGCCAREHIRQAATISRRTAGDIPLSAGSCAYCRGGGNQTRRQRASDGTGPYPYRGAQRYPGRCRAGWSRTLP